ncbi:MAG: flagellar protein FlaG [Clostridiales bacterium]|nr:flagellar protein FlaG [Clostridiales bacterium]
MNSDVGRVQGKPTERTTSGDKNVKKPDKENIKEVMNDEMLQKSVDQANKSLEMYNRTIERSVHEVTHTVMYTVKDTITNEVIQEFPPKKIQDMIAKMWELAGLFVDERA